MDHAGKDNHANDGKGDQSKHDGDLKSAKNDDCQPYQGEDLPKKDNCRSKLSDDRGIGGGDRSPGESTSQDRLIATAILARAIPDHSGDVHGCSTQLYLLSSCARKTYAVVGDRNSMPFPLENATTTFPGLSPKKHTSSSSYVIVPIASAPASDRDRSLQSTWKSTGPDAAQGLQHDHLVEDVDRARVHLEGEMVLDLAHHLRPARGGLKRGRDHAAKDREVKRRRKLNIDANGMFDRDEGLR